MESNKFKLIDGTLFVESIDCGHHKFGGTVERIQFSSDIQLIPRSEVMQYLSGWHWFARSSYKETEANHGPFEDLDEITEVVIPDSVTRVGLRAFKDCNNLKKVTLGKNLTSIGKMAFDGCAKLEEIVLPDGVGYIGERAFAGCSSLSTLNIPENIEFIHCSSFEDCPFMSKELFRKYLPQFEQSYRAVRKGLKLSILADAEPYVNWNDKNFFAKKVRTKWEAILLYKLKNVNAGARGRVVNKMVNCDNIWVAMDFSKRRSAYEGWEKAELMRLVHDRLMELIQTNPNRMVSAENYESLLQMAQDEKNYEVVSVILNESQKFNSSRMEDYQL
jgi:hypothetical protein